jgi:hypothetical protein
VYEDLAAVGGALPLLRALTTEAESDAERVFISSGGGIRTRDLRVMRGFRGLSYTVICRDFLILSEVAGG